MKLTEEHRRLIEDYGTLIHQNSDKIDPKQEYTLRALFIGFAIGRGFPIEEAADLGFYQEAFVRGLLSRRNLI